jgi:hypothetical protein
VFVEMFLRDILQWKKLVDAGVVNEDIEPAECLFRFGKEAFNFRLLSHVRADSDRLSALFCNFIYDAISSFLARRIVNDHGRALSSEMFGDCSTDPF